MIPILGSGRWRLVCGLVANGLGQAGAVIAVALLVEHGLARLGAGGPDPDTIVGLLVGVASAAAAISWLRARALVAGERLGRGYVLAVRLDLFDHLVATRPRVGDRRSTGPIALRFVGDLSAIGRWVSLGLAQSIVAVTALAATLASLWAIEPMLVGVTAWAGAVAVGGASLVGPGLRSHLGGLGRLGRLAAVIEGSGSLAVGALLSGRWWLVSTLRSSPRERSPWPPWSPNSAAWPRSRTIASGLP